MTIITLHLPPLHLSYPSDPSHFSSYSHHFPTCCIASSDYGRLNNDTWQNKSSVCPFKNTAFLFIRHPFPNSLLSLMHSQISKPLHLSVILSYYTIFTLSMKFQVYLLTSF